MVPHAIPCPAVEAAKHGARHAVARNDALPSFNRPATARRSGYHFGIGRDPRAKAVTTSLVLTVIASDHPGIVNQVSDVAQRFGANWVGSRMASLAGQFAGIVHLEVPDRNVESISAALRGLVSSGLNVVIATGDSSATPAGQRIVRLELVGNDHPGIVRDLSGCLARRGISIEELHTEVVSAAMSAGELFKVKAILAIPETLRDAELKRELEALATEMMVDIEIDSQTAGSPR
jgi:glycine cleavage system regulatory protein